MVKFEFPKGCEDCSAKKHSTKEALKWQCNNGCYWPEKYWKYDEVKRYFTMAIWQQSGVPLYNIDDLVPDDYVKIGFIRRLM